MTVNSTFLQDIAGPITFGSGYEREIADDPYCALDTSEGAYSDSALAARIVAGWFHGGQSSALYAFASTGHFDRDDLLRELADPREDADAQDALRAWIIGAPMSTVEYLQARADDGPNDGEIIVYSGAPVDSAPDDNGVITYADGRTRTGASLEIASHENGLGARIIVGGEVIGSIDRMIDGFAPLMFSHRYSAHPTIGDAVSFVMKEMS